MKRPPMSLAGLVQMAIVSFLFQPSDSLRPLFSLVPDSGIYTPQRWSDVRDKLLEETLSFCGASRLCNGSLAVSGCSVCDRCYCDDACDHYGDCCIDRELDQFSMEEYVEQTQIKLHKTQASCIDTRYQIYRAERPDAENQQRMFTSCPTGFPDGTIRSACESTGLINRDALTDMASVDRLLENWPVSSSQSLLTYKNRACAQCHGHAYDDASIVPWNLKFSCNSDITPKVFGTEREVLTEILTAEQCMVSFSVPVGIPERQCKVMDNDISTIRTCNASGERFLEDSSLWKACEAFSTKMASNSGVGYANIFCYHCQKDYLPFTTPTCRGGMPFPFFVVISPDALSRAKSLQKLTCGCREGQVFDSVKNICRTLHCLPGKRLEGDQCVQWAVNTLGLAYTVSYRLDTQIRSDQLGQMTDRMFPRSEGHFTEVVKELKSVFTDNIFGKDDRFIHFEYFFARTLSRNLTRDPNVTVQLYAAIALEFEANPATIEEKLLTFGNTSWTLSVNGVPAVFTLSLEPEPRDDVLELLVSHQVLISNDLSEGSALPFYLLDVGFRDLGFSFNPWQTASSKTETYIAVKNTIKCPHFAYNLTQTSDFSVIENNSSSLEWDRVFVHNESGVTLTFTDFHVDNNAGKVIACARDIEASMKEPSPSDDIKAIDAFGDALVVTSFVCLALSVVTLFLTFVTYCLLPSLQTLPGKATMGLVFTLMSAMLLFLVGGYLTNESLVACQIVGVATHFFLLSSFCWTVICTSHMYIVFTKMMELNNSVHETSFRFTIYFLLSLFIPAIIVTATITANYVTVTYGGTGSDSAVIIDVTADTTLPLCDVEEDLIGYGAGICYLSNQNSLIFAGLLPILLACVINVLLYVLTIISFQNLTLQQQMVRKESQNNVLIYVKLSSLTGINWLPCMLATFVRSSVIWYIFLVLCGLQGIYVFSAFVLNKRVLKLYRQRLRGKPAGKLSKYTHSDGERKDRVQQVTTGSTDGSPSLS